LNQTARPPWYRKLHWQITLGILLGLSYGLIIRAIFPGDVERWATFSGVFVFLGDLFIRALKMIIIPLIVASVVTGIKSLGDASSLGRIGARTVGYYIASTFLAVALGLVVVNVIQPGVGLDLTVDSATKALEPTPISKVFSDIIPVNALEVFAANKMLPSIFVAILLGLAILVVPDEQSKPLGDLFESLNAVVLKITEWIMATAPVGVGALFVKTLLDPKLANVGEFLVNLGEYSFAVVLGLGLHGVVTLGVMLWVFARRNPFTFLRQMSPALLTAFSTASSSATYPVTLESAVDAGVPRKSATFVLPLGATINMDGTALYEAVAAVFIANALGVDLTFTQQLVIVVTATLAAIGAAGVPSAGLVTMIIVLESVGLPAEAYGLVVAVDRILDMCRTTINVWGDSVGAAIVGHSMQATADG